ncbi:hypothetical protein V1511DRAFT_487039 [Dipodascopsis uninucleata]
MPDAPAAAALPLPFAISSAASSNTGHTSTGHYQSAPPASIHPEKFEEEEQKLFLHQPHQQALRQQHHTIQHQHQHNSILNGGTTLTVNPAVSHPAQSTVPPYTLSVATAVTSSNAATGLAAASQSTSANLRLPPPHRLLSDPQFHQTQYHPMSHMQVAHPLQHNHRQLPPLQNMYTSNASPAPQFAHPAAAPPPQLPHAHAHPHAHVHAHHHGHPVSHELLQSSSMIMGPGHSLPDGVSPRRSRSTSALSLSASPASTVSSADSIAASTSSLSSADTSSKRRAIRNRTSSTGSNGSTGSISSTMSGISADVDCLGRKKPKIPRNPTSWDPHDDMLLRHLKEQQKLGWKDIASHFINRTPNACQFRWRRLMSGSLRGSAVVSNSSNAASPTSSNSTASNTPTTASAPPVVAPTSATTSAPVVALAWANEPQATNPTHNWSSDRLPSPTMIPATTTKPLLPPPEFVDHNRQNPESANTGSPVPALTPVGTQPSTASNTPSPVNDPIGIPTSLSSDKKNPVTKNEQSNVTIKSEKKWSQEEDELVRRSDLRFEELSLLLPSRSENEIWDRISFLKST